MEDLCYLNFGNSLSLFILFFIEIWYDIYLLVYFVNDTENKYYQNKFVKYILFILKFLFLFIFSSKCSILRKMLFESKNRIVLFYQKKKFEIEIVSAKDTLFSNGLEELEIFF